MTALSVLQLLPYPDGAPSRRARSASRATSWSARRPRELLAVRGNRVSMIFQEPMTSLNPLHTIERQVNEVLILHKGLTRDAARARTLELLDQVGIPDAAKRLDAYPHQLSGGQRQRVMIAMALANEPDLLIADEPTTALDVTIQAQILKLLKSLQARYGMALLFITHDLGIVRKMADRVCVMTKGEIVEQGPVAQVFDRPQHAYTQHLLVGRAQGPAGRRRSRRAGDPAARRPEGAFPDQARRAAPHGRLREGGRRRQHRARAKATRSALVGESGSGKTTLGLALLRLEKSQGGIRFDGQDLQKLAPARAAAAAAPDADRVPGPLQLAQPAHVGRRDRRRRARGARHRQRRPSARSMIDAGAARGRARSRRPANAIRTNSPAASASASPSPAPWC